MPVSVTVCLNSFVSLKKKICIEREAMNLKESKEGYVERFGERKGGERNEYISVSKMKEIIL